MPNIFKVEDLIDRWSTGPVVDALTDPTTTGDVDIYVDSPGGYVTSGVRAFNAIRDYANGKVTVHLGAQAASAAAFFPMAADKIIARDDTMFMIHNAWGFAMGGAQDMENEGKVLRSIDSIIAKKLAKKSGNNVDDVADLMAKETFYFGREIVDANFADELKEGDGDMDRTTSLNLTRTAIAEVKNKISQNPQNISELKACLNVFRDSKPSQEEINTDDNDRPELSSEDGKQGDDSMPTAITEEDLKNARNEGLKAGKELMQKSINCHLNFIKKNPEEVVKNLKDGKVFDLEVMTQYTNAEEQTDELQSRNDGGAPPIEPEEGDDKTPELINSLKALNSLKDQYGGDR